MGAFRFYTLFLRHQAPFAGHYLRYMKSIHQTALSFCAGALLVAGFVAAWPAAPIENTSNLVVLTHTSAAEHSRCALLGATAGRRLFGPVDAQGRQTTCILELYGHFNDAGALVLAREVRNPLDVKLWYRTSAYGLVPKGQIVQSCSSSGTGPGCAEFGRWLTAQYPGQR